MVFDTQYSPSVRLTRMSSVRTVKRLHRLYRHLRETAKDYGGGYHVEYYAVLAYRLHMPYNLAGGGNDGHIRAITALLAILETLGLIRFKPRDKASVSVRLSGGGTWAKR